MKLEDYLNHVKPLNTEWKYEKVCDGEGAWAKNGIMDLLLYRVIQNIYISSQNFTIRPV